MASQVLSGSGNVSYTNNTGQNVRVIINYASANHGLTVSWAGVSATSTYARAIGRNLAFSADTSSFSGSVSYTASNMIVLSGYEAQETALPTEVMLAAGQTFSISSPFTVGSYNIVVIPEAG